MTKFSYLIEVTDDNEVTITSPVEGVTSDRSATVQDVIDTSRKVAHDLSHRQLVDSVVNSVASTILAALNPPVETVADKVGKALAERKKNAKATVD